MRLSYSNSEKYVIKFLELNHLPSPTGADCLAAGKWCDSLSSPRKYHTSNCIGIVIQFTPPQPRGGFPVPFHPNFLVCSDYILRKWLGWPEGQGLVLLDTEMWRGWPSPMAVQEGNRSFLGAPLIDYIRERGSAGRIISAMDDSWLGRRLRHAGQVL